MKKIILVCVCLILSWAFKLQAHPHVWVDAQYRLNIATTQIQTLDATWSFDIFTSTSLLMEYDSNADGEILGAEKAALVEVMRTFDQFDFFIKLLISGDTIKPIVEVVDLAIRDQQLWVKLGLSLPEPVDLRQHTLSLAFGDDDLYFAMVPAEDGLLRLTGALVETCTPTYRAAEELSIDTWGDLVCE